MHRIIDLKDVTFMIPVRIDSEQRGLVLSVVLGFLLYHFDTNIIIVEDDSSEKVPQYVPRAILDECEHVYFNSGDAFFHRTKWLNEAANRSQTPIIVNQDADLVCHPLGLEKARDAVLGGDFFCIPYNGYVEYYREGTEAEFATNLDFSVFTPDKIVQTNYSSKGGIVFSLRDRLFEIGMENENFLSWGYEDDEREHRMAMLGYPLKRLDGKLYHFEHQRNENSGFDNPHIQHNIDELSRIRAMSKEELMEHVKQWPWMRETTP